MMTQSMTTKDKIRINLINAMFQEFKNNNLKNKNLC